MRYVPGVGHGRPVLELTRHNLLVLLAKLEDPTSHRMIIDPDHLIIVQAVRDEEHYGNRPAGHMAHDEVPFPTAEIESMRGVDYGESGDLG